MGTDVISPTSGQVAVFEMGEDERGFDDVTDPGGAGGGVVEGAPAAGGEDLPVENHVG